MERVMRNMAEKKEIERVNKEKEEEKKRKEDDIELDNEMIKDLMLLKDKNELNKLQQIIRKNKSSVVLNYLFIRQTLMYEKFQEGDKKLSDTIN